MTNGRAAGTSDTPALTPILPHLTTNGKDADGPAVDKPGIAPWQHPGRHHSKAKAKNKVKSKMGNDIVLEVSA